VTHGQLELPAWRQKKQRWTKGDGHRNGGAMEIHVLYRARFLRRCRNFGRDFETRLGLFGRNYGSFFMCFLAGLDCNPLWAAFRVPIRSNSGVGGPHVPFSGEVDPRATDLLSLQGFRDGNAWHHMDYFRWNYYAVVGLRSGIGPVLARCSRLDTL
jgi:hypothetical protein